jgi:hypothetical protein
MTQLASPPSDALSDMLRSFEVPSTIFCLSELRAPWAFRVEGEAVAKFHLVLEGSALLLWGKETVALAPGDLVVLPRGSAHTPADDADSPAVPLERLLVGDAFDGESGLRYGGAGPLTRLLCGGFAPAQIGQPPMQYLTEVRLRGAAGYLATGRLTVYEIARRAGYQSDAAFAKAFKRRFGLAPGAYRESASQPPQIEIAVLR